MNDLEIEYKKDIGECAIVELDSISMTEEIDTYPFDETDSAEDIIGIINSCEFHWSIIVENLPVEYQCSNNVKIPNPKYVKWLEEKVKSK